MTKLTKKSSTTAEKKSMTQKVIGLGFVTVEARHGFLIEVPKGSGRGDFIRISEHRNVDLSNPETVVRKTTNEQDPSLRVLIDRERWLALAPAFWEEANRRLRANGLAISKFQKNPTEPIPVHPSLGKELCVLCWAVEDAQPELIQCIAQLGGFGAGRKVVVVHNDRSYNRTSSLSLCGLAKSTPRCHCLTSVCQGRWYGSQVST